jgi:hypothetical protein
MSFTTGTSGSAEVGVLATKPVLDELDETSFRQGGQSWKVKMNLTPKPPSTPSKPDRGREERCEQ